MTRILVIAYEAPPRLSAGAIATAKTLRAMEKAFQQPPAIDLICATPSGEVPRDGLNVFDIAATDIAVDVGNIMAATVVMVGALCALSNLVSLDSLLAVVPQCLPPYRTQHIAMNQAALRAGFDSVERDLVPAWSTG